VIALGDLAQVAADARDDGFVVTGPGAISGALWAARHHPATIYNMELAYATPIALGVALAQPSRRVLAIEGDGSMLAGLPALATVARHPAPNLAIVAVVNGIYGTGDNRSPTQMALGADLGAVAIALGWPRDRVVEVRTVGALRPLLATAMAGSGPWLIVAHVDPASYGPSGTRPVPGIDVVDAAIVSRRFLTSADRQ
jgi:thiamine pyrophosphate-dependent acetolactate synthase large subunit-like protein